MGWMKWGWRMRSFYSAFGRKARTLTFVTCALLQLIHVPQILGTARRLLVPNQRTPSNELCGDTVQVAVLPVRPGIFEADTGNRIKKINPIRVHPQLNHLPGTKKIFRPYA